MAIDDFKDEKATNKYDDVVDDSSDEMEMVFLKQLVDKVDEIVSASNKIDYSSSIANTTITNLDFGLSVSKGVYKIRATATISDSVKGTSQTKYVDLTLR